MHKTAKFVRQYLEKKSFDSQSIIDYILSSMNAEGLKNDWGNWRMKDVANPNSWLHSSAKGLKEMIGAIDAAGGGIAPNSLFDVLAKGKK